MVSRESLAIGGRKRCSRCGGFRDRPGQRYCQSCNTIYQRDRRQGRVQVLLTPEEWAEVKLTRQIGAGRETPMVRAMFDSVKPEKLPIGAPLLAGYLNGEYAWPVR